MSFPFNSIPCLNFVLYFVVAGYTQNTSVLYLNSKEQANLRDQYLHNPKVKVLCDSIIRRASEYLSHRPKPLEVIFYEGRLEIDTARIRTRVSLLDMDKVSTLFYATYAKPQPAYGKKIKEFVLAWANRFEPTGNTINENKFVPLLWGYHHFKSEFDPQEQIFVEKWIRKLADKQIARPSTPNNNWQAKRLRLIGLAGGIIGDKNYLDFSIQGLKEYIATAYFPDGTSNDLRQRDALHYHISGLKVLLTVCVNLSAFDQRFDLFDYKAPNGASIRKSVLYTLPYASGEKTHREWVNTKVKLDKERAAAGLAEYQPGKLFDKTEAVPLFEFAVRYEQDWFSVFGQTGAGEYTATWIGLLNSPLVRN